MFFDQLFDGNVFWNIDSAVGKSGPNFKQDVMLVQFFLKKIFADPTLFVDADSLELDGLFGPKTQSFILKFQQLVLRAGQSIVADGQVNRCRGGDFVSKTSGKTYTIIWLNSSYQKRNPSSFPDLRGDGDLPGALISAVSL
jgi:hypothetical protein